jgi:acetyltransferase EpsM
MATVDPAAEGADPAARMRPRPLVVVGGGEHARVVADAARTRPETWRLVAFADPDPAVDAADRLGLPNVGDDVALLAWLEGTHDLERPWLVLGVGSIGVRQAIIDRLGEPTEWATVVHAAAWVSPTATMGPGAVVLAGAVVNSGADVGAHAIVNSGAIVEHDVTLGPFTHVAPGALLGGGTRTGEGSFLGLGARVRDHVVIGDHAVVGMGAVVTDDVAANATVTGSPARTRDGAP